MVYFLGRRGLGIGCGTLVFVSVALLLFAMPVHGMDGDHLKFQSRTSGRKVFPTHRRISNSMRTMRESILHNWNRAWEDAALGLERLLRGWSARDLRRHPSSIGRPRSDLLDRVHEPIYMVRKPKHESPWTAASSSNDSTSGGARPPKREFPSAYTHIKVESGPRMPRISFREPSTLHSADSNKVVEDIVLFQSNRQPDNVEVDLRGVEPLSYETVQALLHLKNRLPKGGNVYLRNVSENANRKLTAMQLTTLFKFVED